MAKILNNQRYADDIVLMAKKTEDLQPLTDNVKTNSQRFGFDMDVIKTKTMVVSSNSNTKV